MILATCKETGLPCHIWVADIQAIEEHGGAHPYSRLYLKDEKQHHEFTLDVTQSKTELKRRIKHERLIPGIEVKSKPISEDADE